MHREGPFLTVEDLLYFEPYQGIGLELLVTLYSPRNQQEVIEYPMFEKLAEALKVHWENIAIALNAVRIRGSTVHNMYKPVGSLRSPQAAGVGFVRFAHSITGFVQCV